MSQKTICDVCEIEIDPNKLVGGIMRNKEIFPVSPLLGSSQPGQTVQKRIVPEVWDLCEACQKIVWGVSEKKKNEL